MSDPQAPCPRPPPPKRMWSRAAIPVIIAGIGGRAAGALRLEAAAVHRHGAEHRERLCPRLRHLLAPKVDGYVTAVAVKDFQPVKAGQVLVQIDDRIYRQKLAQAEAGVQSAQAALDANRPGPDAPTPPRSAWPRPRPASSQAALAKTQVDIKRAEPLLAQGWLAPSQRDVPAGGPAPGRRRRRPGRTANIDIAHQALATTKVNREGAGGDPGQRHAPMSSWPASTWPTPPSARLRTGRWARWG